MDASFCAATSRTRFARRDRLFVLLVEVRRRTRSDKPEPWRIIERVQRLTFSFPSCAARLTQADLLPAHSTPCHQPKNAIHDTGNPNSLRANSSAHGSRHGYTRRTAGAGRHPHRGTPRSLIVLRK